FDSQSLADIESLAEVRLAVFEIAGGVFEKPEAVEAVAGLFGVDSSGNGEGRDAGGFFWVALGVGPFGLAIGGRPIGLAEGGDRKNQDERQSKSRRLGTRRAALEGCPSRHV